MFTKLAYLPLRSFMFSKTTARNLFYRLNSPFFWEYPPKTDAKIIDKLAVISSNHRYICFVLPKCGSSTITSNLYFFEHGVYPKTQQPRSFRRKLSSLLRNELYILQKYFIFTFVRNPYTRIASAYLDKINNPNGSRTVGDQRIRLRLIRYLGKKEHDNISFDMFLDYLALGKGLHGDPHWAPQSRLIGLPIAEIDFIGAIEHIDADLHYVLEKIFGRGSQVRTIAPHATDSARFVATLPAQQLRRIYQLYEEDFMNFGYVRDDVLGGPILPPCTRRNL